MGLGPMVERVIPWTHFARYIFPGILFPAIPWNSVTNSAYQSRTTVQILGTPDSREFIPARELRHGAECVPEWNARHGAPEGARV